MNLNTFHTEDKPVLAKRLFSSSPNGHVTSLRITAGNQLKEHITPVPALLVCVSGEVVFENEAGLSENLSQGDFINIEANSKHWVNALLDSNLLLIK